MRVNYFIPQQLSFKPQVLLRSIFIFLGLYAASCVLVSNCFAQTYTKESTVEVLAGAGTSQSSANYGVINTLAQSTPVTDLAGGYTSGASYRVYPGYISVLNSRIIASHELETQDTVADTDSDGATQVAGVYFPIAINAYDGYGYIARSDSGSDYVLTNSESTFALSTHAVTLDEGIATTNGYETTAGTFSIDLTAVDSGSSSVVTSAADIEVKPAWISNYTITATSPQKQGTKWAERIFSWDAYSNLVTDKSYLATHFDTASVTLTDADSSSSSCTVELYPTLSSTSSSDTQGYTIDETEGRAYAYLIADESGTAQVNLDGAAYSYSLGSATPGSETTFTADSSQIIIQPIIWLVDAQFVYDYDSGELKASGWLEKDGNLVTSGLTAAALSIYNTSGTLLNTLAGTADSQSVYQFSWTGASLSDPTYFATLAISHSGVSRVTNFSFSIDASYEFIQATQTQVATTLPQISTTLAGVADQISNEVATYTDDIDTDVAKVLVASERTLPSQITTVQEQLMDVIVGRIFNTPTLMQYDKSYLVNFQTNSGVSPVLNVYDPDGTLVLQDQAMVEISNSGVYQANITLEASWGTGAFTIVCSESTYDIMDALSVTVAATSIDEVSRDLSAILGSASSSQDMRGFTSQLEEAFDSLKLEIDGMLKDALAAAKQYESPVSIFETLNLEQKMSTTAERIFDRLSEIRKELAAAGMIPETVIDQIVPAEELEDFDLGDLREKFTRVEVLLRLHKQILDDLVNKPVVEIWYEFR